MVDTTDEGFWHYMRERLEDKDDPEYPAFLVEMLRISESCGKCTHFWEEKLREAGFEF